MTYRRTVSFLGFVLIVSLSLIAVADGEAASQSAQERLDRGMQLLQENQPSEALEELQKLIDEGKVVRAEEAGTAAVTIEVPSEAATFVAREGVPALPTVEWAPTTEGVPAEVLDMAGVAPLEEGVALSCTVAAG